MKRLNKELKIETSNNFKIKYGTINCKNPESIYFVGNTYISPIENKLLFNEDVEFIKTKFKTLIKQYLETSKQFESMYVFDFDIRESGLKTNKKSYFSFEIYLKQNKTNILPINELQHIADAFMNNITNSITTTLWLLNFKTFKNKKPVNNF